MRARNLARLEAIEKTVGVQRARNATKVIAAELRAAGVGVDVLRTSRDGNIVIKEHWNDPPAIYEAREAKLEELGRRGYEPKLIITLTDFSGDVEESAEYMARVHARRATPGESPRTGVEQPLLPPGNAATVDPRVPTGPTPSKRGNGRPRYSPGPGKKRRKRKGRQTETGGWEP